MLLNSTTNENCYYMLIVQALGFFIKGLRMLVDFIYEQLLDF